LVRHVIMLRRDLSPAGSVRAIVFGACLPKLRPDKFVDWTAPSLRSHESTSPQPRSGARPPRLKGNNGMAEFIRLST
jgi:hypothetical protein